MNEDILKGKLREIQGKVKETWGKLTDNAFGELEGRGEKLLGLLQKKYGYISDNAELEYKDTVELTEIISRIRAIRTETTKINIMAIVYITRYGKPLFAKNQASQKGEKEETHGRHTDRYFDSRLSRRNTHLAPQ